MNYNTIAKALLLMIRNKGGENIPFASLMPSYGPFLSMEAAYADLVNTFGEIGNVPRGYTFCVIENNKPQEYWLTKAGDWSSKEKKNVSSSSTEIVSGLIIEKRGDYIQVSYDNGETWANLVALADIQGPVGNTGSPGIDGKDAVADLSKVQVKMTSRVVTEPNPEDPEETVSYTEYKLEYTTNGGTNWTNIGTIKSGSGGGSGTDHIITIETWTDGNQYWKQDGNWMRDDNGNMVRANGKDGEDGEDGEGFSTQFKSIIFKRSNNIRIVDGKELLQESEYPQGGTYNSPVPPSGNWYDGVPAGTEKLWMSTRWFSTNEAINDANNWSTPSPATDTADIDFEYSNAPLTSMPLDPGPNKNRNMYNTLTNPNGWYDGDVHSELLVNANWMTMRTCKNGYWNAWKTFKIRGEQGEDAIVPTVEFTSIVFRRSNNTRLVNGKVKLAASEYPEGGSYDSPVPTNRDSQDRLLWTDGLPIGNGEILWMSTRIFRSDGNHSAWTEPIEATDGSNGWDFEWCDDETPQYPYPTRTSPDDNASGKLPDDTWYDEAAQDSDPVWMAIRPFEGNQYTSSNWTVMRVKGERGDDGTSFVPKGQLFGIYDTLAQANAYYDSHTSSLTTQKYAIVGVGMTSLYEFSSTYPDGHQVTPLTIGDAYVNAIGDGKYNQTSGDLKDHVFIWDGDNFVDFGVLKGDKGDSAYFHIKYSNDGGNSFTFSGEVQDGETPGDYIGLRVDYVARDSMNPRDYTWSQFKGEDGFGYEYIFKLTNDENAPSVPQPPYPDYIVNEGTQNERTVTYQDDDYVPDGWTDDPGSPTKRYPYCWVAYRRKIGGIWQAYRGGSADPTRAALFSVYTSNGRGIDHIEEMYALGTSRTTAPDLNAFGSTVPEFDFAHGLIYLWNYEIIHYDDDTTQTTDPECIAVSERGVGISSIQEFYYACSYGKYENLQNNLPQWGGENRSDSWKTKPMNVDKTNPFLWNFELITYTDGTQTWTDPVIIAYYVYTDIEYLMTVFKKVEGNSDTAYLGGLVGVVERGSDNNDVLRAMLNATNLGSNEHGKLIMASGFNGHNDVNNATFKVYEDGHVEMRDVLTIDADIQGFLRQYFYRQHDVWEVGDSINNNIKNVNAIQLGWEGLSFVEDGRSVEYQRNVVSVSFMSSLPPGRILLTNQMYSLKDGTTYINNKYSETIITGVFIALNGCSLNYISSGLSLKSGWVELLHIVCKDTDYNTIIPRNEYADKFLILGMGGTISTNGLALSMDVASTDGSLMDNTFSYLQPSTVYKPGSRLEVSSTNITDNIIRIHPSNRYVDIFTNIPNDVYVVLGKWGYNNNDSFGSESYIIRNRHFGNLIFKVEDIGDNTDVADVPSLTDVNFVNMNTNIITRDPAVLSGEYIRITRTGETYAFIVEPIQRL